MADPDETCPGLWVEIDFEIGYCSLGDEWRNPIPDAHPRRTNERPVIDTNDLYSRRRATYPPGCRRNLRPCG